MSTIPEGITSAADVIVWGEGHTIAQQIAAGQHRLTGDEPENVEGSDTGPSPYDFLLAALGSCTSMTVGMYARKKSGRCNESQLGFDIRRSTLQTAQNVKREKACSTESSAMCDLTDP